MPDKEIKKIADQAEMIVAGYAFTYTDDGQIRVLNLEEPSQAAVISTDGEMIETTMDDSTLALVQAYYLNNREFVEDSNA